MKKTSLRLILCLLLTCMIAFAGCSGEQKIPKPSPDQVIQMLKDGNERFLNGKSEHPHLDKERMRQASLEDQGNHAYATILASSDSRVPVEAIFDAGIMDIFAVRVPGNVCNPDQVSAIEYGIEQIRTPVVVVLGNTQCPAVTAVTRAMNEHGKDMEKNIPPMFAGIKPAVQRTMEKYPKAKGDSIITLAIEENIYISIRDLFLNSPATRERVKAGKVKVAGAIYDVSDGRVYWLEDTTVDSILQEVEGKPDDTQAPDTPEASDGAVPEAQEEVQQVHENAAETHEAAPEAHGDKANAPAPSEADEATAEPKTHDAEVSHGAAPKAPDANEAHGAATDAPAPPKADETESHDSESHH
ncbi:MAG: carbonic anhydrase [Desulfobacterales bacterium]|nr:carbonic anhydrase [Desulfobacterales bacterium]